MGLRRRRRLRGAGGTTGSRRISRRAMAMGTHGGISGLHMMDSRPRHHRRGRTALCERNRRYMVINAENPVLDDVSESKPGKPHVGSHAGPDHCWIFCQISARSSSKIVT